MESVSQRRMSMSKQAKEIIMFFVFLHHYQIVPPTSNNMCG